MTAFVLDTDTFSLRRKNHPQVLRTSRYTRRPTSA